MSESLESLDKAPKFRVWRRTVEAAGCRIASVEPLCELHKPDGSLLFALLRTRVLDPQGRVLPAYALIRGAAVLVATSVVNTATGQRKLLMLRQRRIGHGMESPEFPAGMLDAEVTDPASVAVREVREETGLEISARDLFPLSDKPLYSSPGLDDEAIHLYGCEIALSDEHFHALEGRLTGNAEEHEHIRLGLWDYADAVREVDSLQSRLALSLWAQRMDAPR